MWACACLRVFYVCKRDSQTKDFISLKNTFNPIWIAAQHLPSQSIVS